MKVSVIVPVYNAQKFIKRSVKSIQTQTYTNLEIILVNDASTDGSLEICKNLAIEDDRIIIIDKKNNQKALKAREDGIRVSKGEFITFCDADDFMPKQAIEKMVAIQKETNSDIILGAVVNFYDRFLLIHSKVHNLSGGLLINETFDEVVLKKKFRLAFYGTHSIPVTSWGKLFRKNMFVDFLRIENPPIHAFDDTYLNLLAFQNAKKITFIKDLVYCYRHGGMTSTVREETLREYLEVHKLRLKLLENTPIDGAKNSIMLEYANTFTQFFYNLVNISKISLKEYTRVLNEAKSSDEFTEMLSYFKLHNFSQKNILDSLAYSSSEQSYQLLIEKSNSAINKRRFKRFLGSLLRRI